MLTTRTLTTGDLLDLIAGLPRHTPIIIKARIGISDACADGHATFAGDLTIENLHHTLKCVELEARG